MDRGFDWGWMGMTGDSVAIGETTIAIGEKIRIVAKLGNLQEEDEL